MIQVVLIVFLLKAWREIAATAVVLFVLAAFGVNGVIALAATAVILNQIE